MTIIDAFSSIWNLFRRWPIRNTWISSLNATTWRIRPSSTIWNIFSTSKMKNTSNTFVILNVYTSSIFSNANNSVKNSFRRATAATSKTSSSTLGNDFSVVETNYWLIPPVYPALPSLHRRPTLVPMRQQGHWMFPLLSFVDSADLSKK